VEVLAEILTPSAPRKSVLKVSIGEQQIKKLPGTRRVALPSVIAPQLATTSLKNPIG